jgi:hypothetical protein
MQAAQDPFSLTPVRRLAANRTGSHGPCPEAARFKLAGMPALAEPCWAWLGQLACLLEALVRSLEWLRAARRRAFEQR